MYRQEKQPDPCIQNQILARIKRTAKKQRALQGTAKGSEGLQTKLLDEVIHDTFNFTYIVHTLLSDSLYLSAGIIYTFYFP